MRKSDCKECEECAVCFDDFKEGVKAIKLPCNHWYHKGCIDPWLDQSVTCPMCRATIDMSALRNAGMVPGVLKGGIVDLTGEDETDLSGDISSSNSSSSGTASPVARAVAAAHRAVARLRGP